MLPDRAIEHVSIFLVSVRVFISWIQVHEEKEQPRNARTKTHRNHTKVTLVSRFAGANMVS